MTVQAPHLLNDSMVRNMGVFGASRVGKGEPGPLGERLPPHAARFHQKGFHVDGVCHVVGEKGFKVSSDFL